VCEPKVVSCISFRCLAILVWLSPSDERCLSVFYRLFRYAFYLTFKAEDWSRMFSSFTGPKEKRPNCLSRIRTFYLRPELRFDLRDREVAPQTRPFNFNQGLFEYKLNKRRRGCVTIHGWRFLLVYSCQVICMNLALTVLHLGSALAYIERLFIKNTGLRKTLLY